MRGENSYTALKRNASRQKILFLPINFTETISWLQWKILANSLASHSATEFKVMPLNSEFCLINIILLRKLPHLNVKFVKKFTLLYFNAFLFSPNRNTGVIFCQLSLEKVCRKRLRFALIRRLVCFWVQMETKNFTKNQKHVPSMYI